MPYYRGGKFGATGGVLLFVIAYVFGLTGDTWVGVFRQNIRTKLIANMGLFQACGFHINLTVSGDTNNCFSMFEPEIPRWVRAVQFFAILGIFLLCIFFIMWTYAMICGDITERRVRVPITIMWLSTGFLMLVHPIIFAYHIRQNVEVVNSSSIFKTVTTTMYLGAFMLHCAVAGIMNFVSLFIILCFCLMRCMDDK